MIGGWRSLVLVMAKHRDLAVGSIVLIIVVIASIVGPMLTSHDPSFGNIMVRLVPPAWSDGGRQAYPLGTDALGRDILSRVLIGGRISLLVGGAAVLVQGVIGVLVGVLAGFAGGRLDSFLMRIADIQLSIPFLILAMAISAALGPGVWKVVLVLGISGWAMYARVARAATLEVGTNTYIEASKALGQRAPMVMLRHILPNIMATLIITATFQAARMILAEASLSFLGLGVPVSIPTWGGMIAGGREYVRAAWWISTLPGFAILLTVLGINLLGNGLRDLLDPRTKS